MEAKGEDDDADAALTSRCRGQARRVQVCSSTLSPGPTEAAGAPSPSPRPAGRPSETGPTCPLLEWAGACSESKLAPRAHRLGLPKHVTRMMVKRPA